MVNSKSYSIQPANTFTATDSVLKSTPDFNTLITAEVPLCYSADTLAAGMSRCGAR